MNTIYKNLGLWMVICLVMIFLFYLFNQSKVPREELKYSQFRSEIEQGTVKSVVIQGDRIKGVFRKGTSTEDETEIPNGNSQVRQHPYAEPLNKSRGRPYRCCLRTIIPGI